MTHSTPVPVLLASQSPARLALLHQAGVDPLVRVSGVDEDAALEAARAAYGELAPEDVSLVLARAKAEAVAQTCEEQVLVLGCDSVLELGDHVHGKPADADEAIARWRQMRGRSGVLHTGHWLVDVREADDGGTGATLGATASTAVHFADIGDAEIEAYVATGEPLRVAGAFTLDGLGAPFVERIEGDPSCVVGLSLPLLRELLDNLDLAWKDIRSA